MEQLQSRENQRTSLKSAIASQPEVSTVASNGRGYVPTRFTMINLRFVVNSGHENLSYAAFTFDKIDARKRTVKDNLISFQFKNAKKE